MAQIKFLDQTGLTLLCEKLANHGFADGLGLSQQNFTTALKKKYDDFVAAGATTADLNGLKNRVSSLESLIEVDSDAAINKFNEIVAFLDGIKNTDTMEGILDGINEQIGDKADKQETDGKFAQVEEAIADAKNYADQADSVIKADLAKKANKATTLAGYGIADAKIANGTITLGTSSIKPITSHQSLANYYTKTETDTALETKVDDADLVAITTAEITAIVTGTGLKPTVPES